MKLRTDAECHRIDSENFTALYNEIQARKAYNVEKPDDKYSHYDAIIDGRVLVEIKRRDFASDAFPDYLMNKAKIDILREAPEDVYGIFFFTDCWFVFSLRQEFAERELTVDNPKKGRIKEKNYVILPQHGKYYTYKTVIPWLDK